MASSAVLATGNTGLLNFVASSLGGDCAEGGVFPLGGGNVLFRREGQAAREVPHRAVHEEVVRLNRGDARF